MPWLQIILESDIYAAEYLSDGLNAIGAISVTLQDAADQPVYEPALNTTPLWERTQVVGLFDDSLDTQQLIQQLQTVLKPLKLPPYHIRSLADQDWTRVWMADFHPLQFGHRLWICPSWHTPPDPHAVNIMLDPGLAFGTGTHATTALCLEWLDQAINLKDKTIIDYGCGSGILAIAAVKLGAIHGWAVDNDPQALSATRDNAQNNQVATQVTTCLPEQLPIQAVDGLLANILANPLIDLVETFATLVKTEGWLVLSGILQNQAADVIKAYARYFTPTEVVERAEWVRIVAKRHTL